MRNVHVAGKARSQSGAKMDKTQFYRYIRSNLIATSRRASQLIRIE